MSCLFYSLSKYHPGISTELMRNKIVDFLLTDPTFEMGKASDIVYWSEDCGLQAYGERMRSPNQMGGAIEIMAYVKLFQKNVHVRVVDTGKIIQFVCNGTDEKSCLYWTGGHYEKDEI